MQIVTYLLENLRASPESLGDPQRETPEELKERHHRVLASSLAALADIVGTTPDSKGTLAFPKSTLQI